MKTVILAGGMGTRLAEETDNRTKPMVEIGGKPIQLLPILIKMDKLLVKENYHGCPNDYNAGPDWWFKIWRQLCLEKSRSLLELLYGESLTAGWRIVLS